MEFNFSKVLAIFPYTNHFELNHPHCGQRPTLIVDAELIGIPILFLCSQRTNERNYKLLRKGVAQLCRFYGLGPRYISIDKILLLRAPFSLFLNSHISHYRSETSAFRPSHPLSSFEIPINYLSHSPSIVHLSHGKFNYRTKLTTDSSDGRMKKS